MTKEATAPEKNGNVVATLNIHQRKREVMRRVHEIAHDKTHPAHGYTYNSIDNISNALRELFVEYGIDYCPSATSDAATMVVELVNVDNPEDKIVSSWPIIEDDKGYAYSTKFPLVRMFLIADGGKDDPAKAGENDESHMAAQRPVQPRATTPRPQSNGAKGDRPVVGPKLACERCAMAGYKNRKGYAATIWPDRWDCDGVDPEGEAQKHPRPVDRDAIPEPQTFADGSPIPDEIPY